MTKLSMEDRLAAMQDGFEFAKTKKDMTFGGIKMDEGEYLGRLQKCVLRITKKDVTMMDTEFLSQGGKYDGQVIYKNYDLDSEWGPVFAIRFIEMSGYDFPTKNVKALPKTLQTIQKDASLYKIECVHSDKGHANFNITDCVEEDEKQTTITKKTSTKATTSEKKASPKKTASKKKDTPDLDGMDRKTLKAYSKANDLGLKFKRTMDEETIRSMVKEAVGIVNGDDKDKKNVPTDEELHTRLLTFCKSQGLKQIKADMELDDIIDEIEEYEFEADELEDDEKELLKMLTLNSCIKE